MKKENGIMLCKLILIIVVMLFIITLAIVIINKSGNQRVAIDSNKFKNYMQSKNYTVGATIKDKDMIEAFTAKDEQKNIESNFYVYKDVESAKKSFERMKSLLKGTEGENANIKTENSGNYSKFSLTSSSNKFVVVSRIDNTAINLVCDIKYRKEFEDILSDLGY